MSQAENIYDTTLNIFKVAQNENIPTYLAANRIAENRIAAIASVKRGF
jgi:leucine dehydrogenase